MTDVAAIATELSAATRERRIIDTPSSRIPGFDLATAYAVERELTARRTAAGARVTGVKVGYANKAMWRALKLETLVWANMYDDTVRFAGGNRATLSIAAMTRPKIEPEIVFKLRDPIAPGTTEAVEILKAVEWYALGFEIIDSVYTDWKFTPADFVASYGLHAALVVGEPQPLASADLAVIAEQLAAFKVTLAKNGEGVAEGAGKNSLRSPALCLAELTSAMSRQDPPRPLQAGDLISSGTLTESQFMTPGETWTARVDGLALLELALTVG